MERGEEADVRSWVSCVDTVEGPLLTRGFCFVVLYKAGPPFIF
jgi:hypothetical protein